MAKTITIDGSGRLVIPKAVRRRHHLRTGSRLELIEDEDRLILVPVSSQPTTRERAGLLVFTGKVAGPAPGHRDLRESRLSRLAKE